VIFGAVILLFLIKVAVQRFNKFDVLSVLVLIPSVLVPLIGTTAYLLQTVAISAAVGALAVAGGASRRGTLFISITQLFSCMMVEHRRLLTVGIEDADRCAITTTGAVLQTFLAALVTYIALLDDESEARSETNAQEIEMRLWLAGILTLSAVCAWYAVHECDDTSEHLVSNLLFFARLAALTVACVANGEDEIQQLAKVVHGRTIVPWLL